MKNLKILYIDTPFIGFHSGDKNRSKFLYEALLDSYKTDICLVEDKDYTKDIINEHQKNNSLFTIKRKKASFFSPNAVFNFDKESKKSFKKIIENGNYDICFFRFSSLAVLANVIEQLKIKIIVDVDMIFSQIAQVVWMQNKTFTNRYFLFESFKLKLFENSFFKKNYTFLYTNENEIDLIQKKYKIKDLTKHKVLPNVINKMEEKTNIDFHEKYILFYGVLNSTVNLSAYDFLLKKIYPLIEDFLGKNKIKIYIVGKNATSKHSNLPSNMKLIGKVDDLASYIKNSLFVLFPLTVASGTLTRVLEVAYLKKSIIATKKASNGLNLEGKIFICKDEKEIARDIFTLCSKKNKKEKYENLAYEFVKEKHSFFKVKKNLETIIYNQLKINVLHIPRRFTKSHWGGTENVVLSIAKGLEKFNVNSKIVTTKILNSKNQEYLDSIEIKRFNYFYPYLNLKKDAKKSLDLVGGNLFSWSILKYLLFVKDVDLIHLHTAKRLGSIARTICKIRDIPYIITIHGGLFDIQKDELKNRLEPTKKTFEWGKLLGFLFGSRRVYKDANSIITLSKNEFKETTKTYPKKDVKLMTNSVNIKQFKIDKSSTFRKKYKISNEAKIFFSSGRIDPQKNQLLVLRSFKKLLNTKPNVHLIFAGNITNNEYLEEIENYIKKENLSKFVTIITNLKPNSQELIDLYVNSDIFVLASIHEPFGIVALEAQAAKLPLIISNICGVCNVLKDKYDALFFENTNLESLYLKMKSLLENEKLKKNLIINATKEIAKYDENLINNNLYNIYKETIASFKN